VLEGVLIFENAMDEEELTATKFLSVNEFDIKSDLVF